MESLLDCKIHIRIKLLHNNMHTLTLLNIHMLLKTSSNVFFLNIIDFSIWPLYWSIVIP